MIIERQRVLEEAAMHSDYSEHLGLWSEWYASSFVKNLDEANNELRVRGIEVQDIEAELSSKCTSTDTAVRERSFRKTYQRSFTAALNAKPTFNPEAYMRNRLEKFEFNILPRHAATEALRSLESLASTAQPRVRAAVLISSWNR